MRYDRAPIVSQAMMRRRIAVLCVIDRGAAARSTHRHPRPQGDDVAMLAVVSPSVSAMAAWPVIIIWGVGIRPVFGSVFERKHMKLKVALIPLKDIITRHCPGP
jgi:hypothetical protein